MATPDARLWSSSNRTPSFSQPSLYSLTGFLFAKFVTLFIFRLSIVRLSIFVGLSVLVFWVFKGIIRWFEIFKLQIPSMVLSKTSKFFL